MTKKITGACLIGGEDAQAKILAAVERERKAEKEYNETMFNDFENMHLKARRLTVFNSRVNFMPGLLCSMSDYEKLCKWYTNNYLMIDSTNSFYSGFEYAGVKIWPCPVLQPKEFKVISILTQ